MQLLATGQYVGSNVYTLRCNTVVVSENIYPAGYSSHWHYHENPFFTFILRGGSVEKRKRGEIYCTPGKLLYYDLHEPHTNQSYLRGSRNFSVEFDNRWLKDVPLSGKMRNRVMSVEAHTLKRQMIEMLIEAGNDAVDRPSQLECMAIQLIEELYDDHKKYHGTAPKWLKQIRDLIDADATKVPDLNQLAGLFGVHPVTICKLFRVYFGCTLGSYIRGRKIETSFALLAQRHLSLAVIAGRCGFSDHAHFTRMFKRYCSITPVHYRKLLFG